VHNVNHRGAEPHPFIPRIICNQAKTFKIIKKQPGASLVAAGLNVPPEVRKIVTMSSFADKIEEMHEITLELSRPETWICPNFFNFLELDQKLRALRDEMKPLEGVIGVLSVQKLNQKYGLSTTGTKAEILERLYSHVDYFHADHSE